VTKRKNEYLHTAWEVPPLRQVPAHVVFKMKTSAEKAKIKERTIASTYIRTLFSHKKRNKNND